MRFRDISQDTATRYTLKKDERVAFYLENRGGSVVFELAEPGAEAHIFALFTRDISGAVALQVRQEHRAPRTGSSLLVKSVLSGEAKIRVEGLIRIEPGADGSSATQESRALLLSPQAEASTIPSLEILANDVICHHAATVSPLNPETLFYAEARGLSEIQATELLAEGFARDLFLKMQKLGVPEADIAPLQENLRYA